MGTDEGHQVKTRALENHIYYNRIEDGPDGNSSRVVDVANCGLTFIVGNDFHQGRATSNNSVVGFGAEGCQKRTEDQMRAYLINNTVVNEARSGTLFNNHAGGDVVVANNLIFGRLNVKQKLLDEFPASRIFHTKSYTRTGLYTPFLVPPQYLTENRIPSVVGLENARQFRGTVMPKWKCWRAASTKLVGSWESHSPGGSWYLKRMINESMLDG